MNRMWDVGFATLDIINQTILMLKSEFQKFNVYLKKIEMFLVYSPLVGKKKFV